MWTEGGHAKCASSFLSRLYLLSKCESTVSSYKLSILILVVVQGYSPYIFQSQTLVTRPIFNDDNLSPLYKGQSHSTVLLFQTGVETIFDTVVRTSCEPWVLGNPSPSVPMLRFQFNYSLVFFRCPAYSHSLMHWKIR